MSKEGKASKRELVMRGGPWTSAEQKEVLDYCEEDVASVERLLPTMLPEILARTNDRMLSLGQALLRGRFMSAVAGCSGRVPLSTRRCIRDLSPTGRRSRSA